MGRGCHYPFHGKNRDPTTSTYGDKDGYHGSRLYYAALHGLMGNLRRKNQPKCVNAGCSQRVSSKLEYEKNNMEAARL